MKRQDLVLHSKRRGDGSVEYIDVEIKDELVCDAVMNGYEDVDDVEIVATYCKSIKNGEFDEDHTWAVLADIQLDYEGQTDPKTFVENRVVFYTDDQTSIMRRVDNGWPIEWVVKNIEGPTVL